MPDKRVERLELGLQRKDLPRTVGQATAQFVVPDDGVVLCQRFHELAVGWHLPCQTQMRHPTGEVHDRKAAADNRIRDAATWRGGEPDYLLHRDQHAITIATVPMR